MILASIVCCANNILTNFKTKYNTWSLDTQVYLTYKRALPVQQLQSNQTKLKKKVMLAMNQHLLVEYTRSKDSWLGITISYI